MARQAINAAIVDTSVIVKWFSRERDVEAALRLREDLAGDRLRLSAPDLLLYELANALRFHPGFRAEDAISAVESVIDIGIRFVPASARLMREAVEMAFNLKITVYDAAFAALAALEEVPFLTADEKLAGKIGSACKVVPLGRYDDPASLHSLK